MAHKTRPRLLYPGLWDSEKFYELSDRAFRAWSFLLTQADDEGCGKLAPAALRFRPFPKHPLSADDEAEVRAELEAARLVRFYSVDGRDYYKMHDWSDFQHLRADRREPSSYPPPPGCQADASMSTNLTPECQPTGCHDDALKVKVKDNGNGSAARACDYSVIAERCLCELNRRRAAKHQAPCPMSMQVMQAIERGVTLHGYTEQDFLRVLQLKAPLLDNDKPEVRQAFSPLKLWGYKMPEYLALPAPEPEKQPRPQAHKVHVERELTDEEKVAAAQARKEAMAQFKRIIGGEEAAEDAARSP